MKYKILLMGPQGSGKGTQADMLSKKFDIPSFGMGQLLRDEMASGSEIGKEAEAIVLRGDLVSDQMAAKVLKMRLARPDTENGYLLDGYPRNEAQYKAFNFDVPTHVIVIDIDKDESLKRLSGRLTCKGCSKVYAMKDGYKAGDKCECGGELFVRDDDTPEAISKRLDIYYNDTEPIVAKYEEQGLVHRVNGVGSIEEIFDRIMKVLN